MRISVKSIIKWGLIAEIITAMIGQAGEFTLRYRSYTSAFEQLFGRYDHGIGSPHRTAAPQKLSLRAEMDSSTQVFRLDPRTSHKMMPNSTGHSNKTTTRNNQRKYSRQNGGWKSGTNHSAKQQNPQWQMIRSETIKKRLVSSARPPQPPPQPQQYKNKTSGAIVTWSLDPEARAHRIRPAPDSGLFSFESYTSSVHDILREYGSTAAGATRGKSHDPRPMLVCAVLLALKLLFIIAIVNDYMPIICPLTVVSMLYLILVLLILHAGTSGSITTTSITSDRASWRSSSSSSPWNTLTPSPFTILVESIIIVFSVILIAIIAEERRQIALRIRAKSAAIPLVKSRDMDLDEI